MVYPKVLFPPNFIIKDQRAESLSFTAGCTPSPVRSLHKQKHHDLIKPDERADSLRFFRPAVHPIQCTDLPPAFHSQRDVTAVPAKARLISQLSH